MRIPGCGGHKTAWHRCGVVAALERAALWLVALTSQRFREQLLHVSALVNRNDLPRCVDGDSAHRGVKISSLPRGMIFSVLLGAVPVLAGVVLGLTVESAPNFWFVSQI